MTRGVAHDPSSDKRRRARPDLAQRNLRHGLRRNRFYIVWLSIKNRCYNKENKDYPLYGGKGVALSAEWLNDPEAFIRWCEERCPGPEHSLDRYPDKNGPYSPANLRFASPSQQNRNKRNNVVVVHEGKPMTFAEFIEGYAVVSKTTIKKRVREGWGRVQAVLTPDRRRKN